MLNLINCAITFIKPHRRKSYSMTTNQHLLNLKQCTNMLCELPLVIPKSFSYRNTSRKLKMEDLHPRDSCLGEIRTELRLKTVKWLLCITSKFIKWNIFNFEHACFHMRFAASGYCDD